METKQIHDALSRLFEDEEQRLVFWNDPGQEFADILPTLQLDNVKVLRLDQMGALEAKIRLEQDDPTGRYLLYSPTEEPAYENDWLLDIRLYSRSFRADRASIILQELGLLDQSLRQHLAERTHDAASSPHENSCRVVSSGRTVPLRAIAASEVLTRGKDEAATFERDVPDGRQPGFTVICGGGAIDFHSLRIHGRPKQRHVIFPADHRS